MGRQKRGAKVQSALLAAGLSSNPSLQRNLDAPSGAHTALRLLPTSGQGHTAPRPPLPVRIDGELYDLADFDHPGGHEVLRRTAGAAGGDITHLFYSNHREPRVSELRHFRLPEASVPLVDAGEETSEPHSAVYRELKSEVYAHLEARGVEWRHTFRWEP